MKEYYLSISNCSQSSLLEKLKKSMKDKKKEFVVTANAEIFMEALNNQDIDKILTNRINTIIADGISIIKTAKYFGIDINEKIAGVEICAELLRFSYMNNYSIFVYGCKQIVLDLLAKEYPDNNLITMKNGYDYSDEEIKKEILNKRPDLVIVALGVPKQEKFIDSIFKQAKKGVFIGVGGSIDVISGYKKRAPRFYRKHNLEWLYRILKEPKRIKRFINNNLKLLFVAKKTSRKEEKK